MLSRIGARARPSLDTSPRLDDDGVWEEFRRNLMPDPIVPAAANSHWQVNAAAWNNPTRLEMGTLFEVGSTPPTALAYIARPNTTEGLAQLTAGNDYYFRWEMENRSDVPVTLRTLIMRGTVVTAITPINTFELGPREHFTRVQKFTPTISDGYRLGMQMEGDGSGAGAALFIPDSWGIFEDRNTALVSGQRLYPQP